MNIMLHLTSNNFTVEINRSTLPVVVMFYALWCGKCAMMKPMIEELEKSTGDASGSAKLRSMNLLCSPLIMAPIQFRPSPFSFGADASARCRDCSTRPYSNDVYKKSLEIVKAYFICKHDRICYIMKDLRKRGYR